jgi:hypothetical protein
MNITTPPRATSLHRLTVANDGEDPTDPADLFRAAADLLEQLDRDANDGPWTAGRTVLDDTGLHAPSGSEIAVTYWTPDARLIVSLRPLAPHLAVTLRSTADRWDANVLLDRPESGEMEPAYPQAWFCGHCQGAIESADYPGEDQRCDCGWWSEALTLALATLRPALEDWPCPNPSDPEGCYCPGDEHVDAAAVLAQVDADQDETSAA